jgi:hypothetical protein
MGEEADDRFLEEIIEDLRADEGSLFRRLIIRLRTEEHPEARALFHTLVTHPDLRDLVPH